MSRQLIFILLLLGGTLYAQTPIEKFEEDCEDELLCEEFDLIRRRTLNFLEKGEAGLAYEQLKALESCTKCPEHRDNLDAISRRIIDIFSEQQDTLEASSRDLLATIAQRDAEKARLNRQLNINKEITREALVNNYILRLAEGYRENALDRAREFGGHLDEQPDWSRSLWLTDFTYSYVDSTHHSVKKMMHRLYHDKLIKSYPEGYFESEYTGPGGDGLTDDIIISAVEASPDERWLAAGLSNGRLVIFHIDGRVVFDEFVSSNLIEHLAWSPKPRTEYLAFLQNDNELSFVGSNSSGEWEVLDESYFADNPLNAIRWSPVEEALIALGSTQGDVLIYDRNIADLQHTLSGGHSDWIRDLAWSPDGTKLLACDDSGAIVNWDWTNEQVLWKNDEAHTDYVRTIDWNPDGSTIVSGGDDYFLRLWTADGDLKNEEQLDAWVFKARFDVTGRRLAAITTNTFYAYTASGVYTTPIAPWVRRFAWIGTKNTMDESDQRQLDFSEESFFKVPTNSFSSLQPGQITSLSWSDDEEYLAYIKGSSLMIMSEEKLLEIKIPDASALCLDWQPMPEESEDGGPFLAVGLNTNQVFLLDAARNTIRFQEIDAVPLSMAWSPDGSQLAMGMLTGELFLLDANLQERYRTNLHEDYIRAIAWSPNGRFLATGSDDYSSVVYNVASQEIADRFSGHSDWVRDVVWLDNRHFASVGDDSNTLIWQFPRPQLARSRTDGAQRREFPIRLKDLGNYLLSIAYYPLPDQESGWLAVGSRGEGESENVALYAINMSPQLTAKREEVLKTGFPVFDLDWKIDQAVPSLTMSSNGVLPEEIQMLSELQQQTLVPVSSIVVEQEDYRTLSAAQQNTTKDLYTPRLRTLPGRTDLVQWTPDETILAVINDRSELEVHDMEAGTQLYELSAGDDQDFEHFCLSNNGQYVAAVVRSTEQAYIWQLTPSLDTSLISIPGRVMDWTFTADNRYLMILDQEFAVYRYDVRTQQLERFENEISSNVTGVGTDDDRYADGTIIAHPSRARSAFILRLDEIYHLNTSDGRLTLAYEGKPIRFNPDPEYLPRVSQGHWLQNGDVLVFEQEGIGPQFLELQSTSFQFIRELFDEQAIYAWADAPQSIWCEALPLEDNYDNKYDADDLSGALLRLVYSAEGYAKLEQVKNQYVQDLSLSADGSLLATLGYQMERLTGDDAGKYQIAGDAPFIRLFEVASKEEVMELRVAGLTKVEFSPRGNYLYTLHSNGRIGIWPLDIVGVNQFMQQQGKENFMRAGQTKEESSLADEIKEWELLEGLEFRRTENIRSLHRRESPSTRRSWSTYFVDQAWSSFDHQERKRQLNKAMIVHQSLGSGRVLKTRIDTLALTEVFVEHAHRELDVGNSRQVDYWLRRARSLNADPNRVSAIQLLSRWRQSNGRPMSNLLECLSEGSCQRAIDQEYKRLVTKGVTLPEARKLERFLALGASEYDLVSPVDNPLIQELLEGYRSELSVPLIMRYYVVNNDHPTLSYAGEVDVREAFYRQAISYMDEHFEYIRQDENMLRDYIGFLGEQRQVAEDKNKPKSAFTIARKAVQRAKLLLDLEPNDPQKQNLLMEQLASYYRLNLQLNPDRESARQMATEIQEEIQNYPQAEAVDLLIIKGHVEVLNGNIANGLQDYYRVLAAEETYDKGGMIQLILGELESIDRRAASTLSPSIRNIGRFLSAEQEMFAAMQEETFSGATPAQPLDKYKVRYQLAIQRAIWVGKLPDAVKPKGKSERRILVEEEQLLADYAYASLYYGEWKTFSQLVKEAQSKYGEANWPKAAAAIDALLNEDWPSARTQLLAVKAVENDWTVQRAFPMMAALLRNLPNAVQNTSAYQALADRWLQTLE